MRVYTNWLQPTKQQETGHIMKEKEFKISITVHLSTCNTAVYCQAQEGPGCLEEQMAAGLGQTGEKRRWGHPGSAGKLGSLLFSPSDEKKKKSTEEGLCQWLALQTVLCMYMMQSTENQENGRGVSHGT